MSIGLVLADIVAFGLYWGLSKGPSGEDAIPSAPSQARSSFPDSTEARGTFSDFPRGSFEDQSEAPRFSAAPGWEARHTRKKAAPSVEGADETEDLHLLIEEALHAPDPDDRAYAVGELGLWDATPEILTACLEALNDPEEEVREEAVLALEMLEDPSAIPALQRVAQEDPSEDVRDAALEALEDLVD